MCQLLCCLLTVLQPLGLISKVCKAYIQKWNPKGLKREGHWDQQCISPHTFHTQRIERGGFFTTPKNKHMHWSIPMCIQWHLSVQLSGLWWAENEMKVWLYQQQLGEHSKKGGCGGGVSENPVPTQRLNVYYMQHQWVNPPNTNWPRVRTVYNQSFKSCLI